MKKNAMMKIAAILMVAVLLTTCAISSTFAKYTTSGSAKDQARVAKWGVELTVSGNEAMFAKVYGDNLVVADTKVVAPGTSNSNAITFSVSGTPEVKTQLTVDSGTDDQTNFIALNNWEQTIDGVTTYCPLVFTITVDGAVVATCAKGDTYTTVNGDGEEVEVTVEDADDLATYVNTKISEIIASDEYAAGSTIDADFVLGWAWDFDADDKNDTALGNIVADSSKNDPTIAINFNITVEQVSTDEDLANP